MAVRNQRTIDEILEKYQQLFGTTALPRRTRTLFDEGDIARDPPPFRPLEDLLDRTAEHYRQPAPVVPGSPKERPLDRLGLMESQPPVPPGENLTTRPQRVLDELSGPRAALDRLAAQAGTRKNKATMGMAEPVFRTPAQSVLADLLGRENRAKNVLAALPGATPAALPPVTEPASEDVRRGYQDFFGKGSAAPNQTPSALPQLPTSAGGFGRMLGGGVKGILGLAEDVGGITKMVGEEALEYGKQKASELGAGAAEGFLGLPEGSVPTRQGLPFGAKSFAGLFPMGKTDPARQVRRPAPDTPAGQPLTVPDYDTRRLRARQAVSGGRIGPPAIEPPAAADTTAAAPAAPGPAGPVLSPTGVGTPAGEKPSTPAASTGGSLFGIYDTPGRRRMFRNLGRVGAKFSRDIRNASRIGAGLPEDRSPLEPDILDEAVARDEDTLTDAEREMLEAATGLPKGSVPPGSRVSRIRALSDFMEAGTRARAQAEVTRNRQKEGYTEAARKSYERLMVKTNESHEMSNQARQLLINPSSAGDKALATLMPRVVREVGNLAREEQTRFTRRWGPQGIVDLLSIGFTGMFSDAQRSELLTMLDYLDEARKRERIRLGAIVARSAAAAHPDLLDEEELLQMTNQGQRLINTADGLFIVTPEERQQLINEGVIFTEVNQ